MEITNELLAAYAENNVTPEERKQVRKFLVDHPSLLESVMLMMAENDETETTSRRSNVSFMGATPPRLRDIGFARAAFVPSTSACFSESKATATHTAEAKTFSDRLNDLLDEII